MKPFPGGDSIPIGSVKMCQFSRLYPCPFLKGEKYCNNILLENDVPTNTPQLPRRKHQPLSHAELGFRTKLLLFTISARASGSIGRVGGKLTEKTLRIGVSFKKGMKLTNPIWGATEKWSNNTITVGNLYKSSLRIWWVCPLRKGFIAWYYCGYGIFRYF